MNARRVGFLVLAVVFVAVAVTISDSSGLQLAAGVAALVCLVLGGVAGSGGAAGDG